MATAPSSNPQGSSALCQLPNEVLFQIAAYVFEGFYLNYSRTKHIYRPRDVHVNTLSLVRTCRELRQTLVSQLAKSTKTLVIKVPNHDWVPRPRSNQISAMEIALTAQFRNAIVDLDFTFERPRYPHPSLFENLERIHISPKLLKVSEPWLITHSQLDVTDHTCVLDIIDKLVNGEKLDEHEFLVHSYDGFRPLFESSKRTSGKMLLKNYPEEDRIAAGVDLIIHQMFWLPCKQGKKAHRAQTVRYLLR